MLRGNDDLTNYNNIFSANFDYETTPDSNFTNSPDESFRVEKTNKNIYLNTNSSISKTNYGGSEKKKPIEVNDIRDKI